MTARTEEPFQAPLKAPAGHMWFDGVCECGSKYDLQTWATHVELVRMQRVREFQAVFRPWLVGMLCGFATFAAAWGLVR